MDVYTDMWADLNCGFCPLYSTVSSCIRKQNVPRHKSKKSKSRKNPFLRFINMIFGKRTGASGIDVVEVVAIGPTETIPNHIIPLQTPAVETGSCSTVDPESADAPNALPKLIRWSNKIGGFHPRSSHAAVAVGNTIYSFGGFNFAHSTYLREGPLDVCTLIYNEFEMEWKILSIEENECGPNQRLGHSAVVYKEFVLIFGGWDNVENNYSNSTHRFNTKTLEWDRPKVSGNIPEARSRHAAVVSGKDMLIFGGDNMNIALANDVNFLDLDTFQWSIMETKGISPSLRYSHSVSVFEDIMYVFGGRDFESKERSNELFCFDQGSEVV